MSGLAEKHFLQRLNKTNMLFLSQSLVHFIKLLKYYISWNNDTWDVSTIEDGGDYGAYGVNLRAENKKLSKPQPEPQLNLTSTLGWVWHDYHFSHHHPAHRNSTSTRKNDPRCLKFCRRPHQVKLTTPQHNFIFSGGGSFILLLGLTLPSFF